MAGGSRLVATSHVSWLPFRCLQPLLAAGVITRYVYMRVRYLTAREDCNSSRWQMAVEVEVPAIMFWPFRVLFLHLFHFALLRLQTKNKKKKIK